MYYVLQMRTETFTPLFCIRSITGVTTIFKLGGVQAVAARPMVQDPYRMHKIFDPEINL